MIYFLRDNLKAFLEISKTVRLHLVCGSQPCVACSVFHRLLVVVHFLNFFGLCFPSRLFLLGVLFFLA